MSQQTRWLFSSYIKGWISGDVSNAHEKALPKGGPSFQLVYCVSEAAPFDCPQIATEPIHELHKHAAIMQRKE